MSALTVILVTLALAIFHGWCPPRGFPLLNGKAVTVTLLGSTCMLAFGRFAHTSKLSSII
jgi:hypothetical protein